MPLNCFWIVAASGSTVPVAVFELELFPPVTESTTTTATTITAIAASAPPSTHGLALRPPVLRTGGRATAAWRWRLAALPLVIVR